MRTVTVMENQRPVRAQVYVSGGKRHVLQPRGDGKVYVRPARKTKPEGYERLPGKSWAWYARVKQDGCVYYGHGDTIEEAVRDLDATVRLVDQMLTELADERPSLWLPPGPTTWDRLTDWWCRLWVK